MSGPLSVEGIVLLSMSFNRRCAEHWWISQLQGLVRIAVGIITFVCPGITAIAQRVARQESLPDIGRLSLFKRC